MLRGTQIGTTGSGSSVHLLGDQDASAWDAFVQSHHGATHYHLYAWRAFLHQVCNLKTYYLAAREGSAIRGVLPLARQKSLLFGDYLISLPYFNYGGLLADHPAARDALLEQARALGAELGIEHIELRHTSDQGIELPERTDKISMVLQLPDTVVELRDLLKAKVRAQIKRPEREGVCCEHGGIELLADFYRVFAQNMRDLGTPVYPIRFFREILLRFEQQVRIFVTRLSGRPVAAALVLGHRSTLEIPWASSLREANKLGVNMYLYWQVLSWAIESGYASFDFGRCTRDSGTHRFKKQWGAEPLQLHWHYMLFRGQQIPQINHSNAKYRTLVKLWQKQPVALANVLGPMFARYLP